VLNDHGVFVVSNIEAYVSGIAFPSDSNQPKYEAAMDRNQP